MSDLEPQAGLRRREAPAEPLKRSIAGCIKALSRESPTSR